MVIYYDIDKKDIRSFKDYLLKSIKTKPKTKKIEDKPTNKSKPKPNDKKLNNKDNKKTIDDNQQTTND